MQAKFRLTYLGMDSFTGKKDPTKTYHQANFLQNNEVVKVFLESGQEVFFEAYEKFDEVIAVLSYSLGTDKYGARINYRLLSMEPAEPDLPYDDIKRKDENKSPAENKKEKTVA